MDAVHGWVHIRQLQIPSASVGIYPRERRARQPISIDISLLLEMTSAARDERIVGTIDYDAVSALARELTLARHYPLIESLAYTLGTSILERFDVLEVRVEVHKPDALPDATASVELKLRLNE